MSIAITVGHGKGTNGKYDPGACSNGYQEFKIAKEISKYAQTFYNNTYLEKCDLINYNGDTNLEGRIQKANNNKYSFVAEIHLNAGGGTGTEVYYSVKGDTSKNYAIAISQSIAKVLGIYNRGTKIKTNSSRTDYFGIIRRVTVPSILVECCFIDSASDLAKIKTAAGQKACGEAIAKAIASVRKPAIKTVAEPVTQNTNNSFLPARGYFKQGDKSANVGLIAAFMRKTFPSYTPTAALGNIYGSNLIKAIKEFQKRTGLKPDGYTGSQTLAMLRKYGFKY